MSSESLAAAPTAAPVSSSSDQGGKSPATWVPTLYFAEGLPNVVTVVVSVLMYKSMGLGDGEIAFLTSFITYPWILKPLWSPLLELVKNRKRAVVVTQILGGAMFGCLALAIPSPGFLPITLAIFALIAFNSATHDIVADGIYVSALDSTNQAKYVGIQGASYNIARFLAQGGFVMLAGTLEQKLGVNPAWMAVMALVGIFMILSGAWHAKTLPSVPPASETPPSVSEAFRTFGDVVKTFFQKKNVWWALAFICLYRFAEGNLSKIAPLFMRADRAVGGLGLSTSEVGLAYGFVGSIAFVLGSLTAGYMTSRRGLKRSLLLLCLMFNVPNVMFTLLAFTQPENIWAIIGAVWLETFGFGFGFVALPLFMMQELAPGPYKMAHYAFGTALMFLGYLAPSSVSGYISDALGYKMHFVWVLIATIPSFFVAWKVPILNEPPRAT